MASGLRLARLRCTGCGNCCRGLRVPITLADLGRLREATGLEPGEIVEWARADEVDMSGEPGILAVLPEGPRVMLLARRGEACALLDADSRCAVYAARPAACRAYPLHASFGARGGLKRLRVLRGPDCAYELSGPPALAAVRRDQLTLRRELAAHQEAVAAFNGAQRRRLRLGRRRASAESFLAAHVVPMSAACAQPQLSQPIKDAPMHP